MRREGTIKKQGAYCQNRGTHAQREERHGQKNVINRDTVKKRHARSKKVIYPFVVVTPFFGSTMGGPAVDPRILLQSKLVITSVMM